MGIIPREMAGKSIDDLPPSAQRYWPTPRATDAMTEFMETIGARLEAGSAYRHRLEEAVSLAGSTHGQLNPTWVEWLMGFPLGWTDLGPSETRSSRRSSK